MICNQQLANINNKLTGLIQQLLQPFYGSLDFAWDYPGEPVPER